ncbi:MULTISPECIES: nuclear transport factor 2 family protein [Dyella]|uniref:SnoaL-like domain-containing protein n=2 Tax=Dyella TaxID=231454 RepID=A0A4R0YIH0_9GAMM|nr:MULTISPECIES: nuclear transport factor 2 family protein [Dyella]TBR36220.1 hypothetical protein EYV96_16665 [Dyella terrae]TCI05877.1 hypothetical protein EZM97_35755 [Dyella soli]
MTLHRIFLAIALSAGFTGTANAAEPPKQPREEIQQVVDRFRTAIIQRDGETMRSLFIPGSSWFQAMDDASLKAVLAKEPKARRFSSGDYEKFSQFVGSAKKPIEETFDHIRIETDGIIGTVWFDYTFLEAGKATNHGVETWQMIRTDDGWKISAMLYSVVLDDTGRR